MTAAKGSAKDRLKSTAATSANEGGPDDLTSAEADLQRAIESLANPKLRADTSQWRNRALAAAQLIVGLGLLGLLGYQHFEIKKTRAKVDQLDVDALTKASRDVVRTVDELNAIPEKLQAHDKPDRLGWLRQLPESIDTARRKVDQELLPAIDGDKGVKPRLESAVASLKSVSDEELPTIREQVKEMEDLLKSAASTEEEAGARLTRTVREVREMLTHIRYVATGESGKVRLAIVRRKFPPRVLNDLLPAEADWARFQATHPNWSIESGIIVEGKFRSLKSYGDLAQGDPSRIEDFQPESGFRYVLVVEAESPAPKSESTERVDALIVVQKNGMSNEAWKQYVSWSDFCRKTSGEARLLAYDFEGQLAEMKLTEDAKRAGKRSVFRLASPQWPLVDMSNPNKPPITQK